MSSSTVKLPPGSTRFRPHADLCGLYVGAVFCATWPERDEVIQKKYSNRRKEHWYLASKLIIDRNVSLFFKISSYKCL